MYKTVLILKILGVAAATTACSFSTGSEPADQVVQDYYGYVANHDAQNTGRLLSPDVTSGGSNPDQYFKNVESISRVVVTQPHNIRLNDKFKYEVQVVATYDAQYKKVITSPSGRQTRFIYLGRDTSSQTWKIIAIGTGP